MMRSLRASRPVSTRVSPKKKPQTTRNLNQMSYVG